MYCKPFCMTMYISIRRIKCLSVCLYRVTRWHRLGGDYLVSNFARKYTGSTIFTVCIVYIAIVYWHFHTYTWKIFGKHAESAYIGPLYNGGAVYSESRTFGRFEPIWFFLSQFLFSWAIGSIGECQREPWLHMHIRVCVSSEVPGSIPSQGPRHTKDVIKWYQ